MRLALAPLVVLSLALTGCTVEQRPAATAAPASHSPSPSVAAATASARLDATALFRAFVDALNRGDAAAALALFKADATWERGGQCPAGQCVGLARLAQEVERDVANHHRMDIVALDASV